MEATPSQEHFISIQYKNKRRQRRTGLLASFLSLLPNYGPCAQIRRVCGPCGGGPTTHLPSGVVALCSPTLPRSHFAPLRLCSGGRGNLLLGFSSAKRGEGPPSGHGGGGALRTYWRPAGGLAYKKNIKTFKLVVLLNVFMYNAETAVSHKASRVSLPISNPPSPAQENTGK